MRGRMELECEEYELKLRRMKMGCETYEVKIKAHEDGLRDV